MSENSQLLSRVARWVVVLLFVAAVNLCCYTYLVREQSGPPHTWVDELPVRYSVDVMLDLPLERRLSNIDPPACWVGTANKGSVIRLVTDKVTGEQVQVVNVGWRDSGCIKYRILRRVRINFSDYEEGWTEDRGRIGDFWVAEERRVEELAEIPSI